jgi:hypothetical protein
MYNATGRSLLFQNIEMTDNNANNEQRINFTSFKVKDNILWGVSYELNGLFSVDLATKTLKFHGGVPGERMFDAYLHISLSVNEDCAILIPFEGKSVAKYDARKNAFETAPLDSVSAGKFFDSHEYDGNLYIQPRLYPALIKYNIETGKITENKELCAALDKIGANGSYYFLKGGVLNGNVLTLASSVGNIVVRYDMKTDRFKLYNVGRPNNNYFFIDYDGENYLLFPFKGGIVKWNAQTGAVTEIGKFPAAFMSGATYDYRCSVVFDGDVFVFPCQSNMVLKLDSKTNTTEAFINLDERMCGRSFARGSPKYFHAERVGEYIYASSYYENALQKINPKTGEIENIPLVLSDADCAAIMSNPLFTAEDGSKVYPYQSYENSFVTLDFFLERLVCEDIDDESVSYELTEKMFANADGTCGAKTHEYIKSEVSV